MVITKNIQNLFKIVHLRATLDKTSDGLDRALDRFRDLIDILGFDDSFEIVLENLCEVV